MLKSLKKKKKKKGLPLIIVLHSYETFVKQLIMYFQEFGQVTGAGKLGNSERSPTTTDSEDYLSDSTDSESTGSENYLSKPLHHTHFKYYLPGPPLYNKTSLIRSAQGQKF